MSPIEELLRDEIEKQGPIPFVRFMEMALYHPEYGYYASPREKIGPQGDFYTSPLVHPIFAKLIAKQIVQMAEAIGSDDPISLIEFGAGDGLLCKNILRFIEEQYPSLFNRLQYLIIEESPSFRTTQQERLLPLYSQKVRWEKTMPKGSIGIVLSNELMDAFPVHRLRMERQSLQEVYLTWEGDRFAEILRPLSTPDLLTYWNRLDIQTEKTFDLEINLRGLDWMREVGQGLAKGFVLTIDYGYPAEQLYIAARRRGTFLCYHKHTVNENPYEHIGEQDMTSHVDFTSLAQVGEEVGLLVVGFTDQTHFLMGLGIAQEMQVYADQMEQSEEAKKHFLAMKQLMAPDRMGRTFKVLIQGKGVPPAVLLDGLTFQAFPKDALTSNRSERPHNS